MKDFIEVYDNALTPEMCKEIMEFFDGAPPELKHSGQVYNCLLYTSDAADE